MTDDQMRKALNCCCCSNCNRCVLFEYRFDDKSSRSNFICIPGDFSWRKNLYSAMVKAIRKNPEVFTSDLVALVNKARVI